MEILIKISMKNTKYQNISPSPSSNLIKIATTKKSPYKKIK
jgi:hypothetical protein